MPWLYQKYAGHDINRDAFMMNLAENRNLAKFFYSDWHPQVFLTMHQMEENGPRFFVPPNTDPIDPELRSAHLAIGGAARRRDGHASCSVTGMSGVVTSAKYDYYWPGFEDSAPIGHNTVCLLTEVASVDIASPVTIPATELRAGFKGLAGLPAADQFSGPVARRSLDPARHRRLQPERRARPAVRRERVSRAAGPELLRHGAARHRERPAKAGRSPSSSRRDQHDPYTTAKLEELLLAGAVEIQRAMEPFRADGEPYPEGTDIVFMTQPYRAYAEDAARATELSGAADGPQRTAGAALRRGRVDAAAADGREGDHHRAPVPAAVADSGSRRQRSSRAPSGASASRPTGCSRVVAMAPRSR